jgi:lipopolysaccharide transport system permease protein
VVLQPFILAIIFSLFFGILRPASEGSVPWTLYYMSALALWSPLTRIVTGGAGSIVGNAALVTRIYIPRPFLPFSVALSGLVDLAAQVPALMFLLIWYGVTPTFGVMLLPVLALIGFVTVVGMSLWMAALNTHFRDIQVILAFAIQAWFFMTPILYSYTIVPSEWQPIYFMNPMALVVAGSRSVLVGTPPPPDFAWPIATVVAIVLLISGFVFFRLLESRFADEL